MQFIYNLKEGKIKTLIKIDLNPDLPAQIKDDSVHR